MELSEIWIGIIIPIIIGPVFIYLKSLRDERVEKRTLIKKQKYEYERDYLLDILKHFFWPLYINLLYIKQYNYYLPIKNKFRYESSSSISNNSDDSYIQSNSRPNSYSLENNVINDNKLNRSPINIESDSSNENYQISININKINNKESKGYSDKEIFLDKTTLNNLEKILSLKYRETILLIETNITKFCIDQELNNELLKFIRYVKIRDVIHEGSLIQEYNVEYFGVENNLELLLDYIKNLLDINNNRYTYLVNNPEV